GKPGGYQDANSRERDRGEPKPGGFLRRDPADALGACGVWLSEHIFSGFLGCSIFETRAKLAQRCPGALRAEE
ncbi:MAG: hypothetical protein P4K98_10590, partial [Bryobacteraceae bacterium]|nr:hypothetical protein [Bryobacteraceae bacterium]